MMDKKPGMSREHQRDLGLVLLGLALSKSDRDRILNSVPSGSLIQEVDMLMDSIRSKDGGPLKAWCAERTATVESGVTIDQAMINAVLAEQDRQEVRRVLGELNHAVKLEDRTALAKRLRECAEKLQPES